MSNDSSNSVVLNEPETHTKDKPKSNILPPYNVILMNDDDHTVVYVVNMLKKIFGYPDEKGTKMAKEVDKEGRSYGPDKMIARCKGSMTAVLEPSI